MEKNQKKLEKKARSLLKEVGIYHRADHKGVHLSGGEQQRVAIARALINDPVVVLADEPTGALDSDSSKEIMELLMELKNKLGMSIILITHNIALASEYSDRIYVMYAGEVMETGSKDVIKNSKNPYTYMLLKCLPDVHKKTESLKVIPGKPPNMTEEFEGCSFSTRCKFSKEICKSAKPSMQEISNDHISRCLRIGEINYNE